MTTMMRAHTCKLMFQFRKSESNRDDDYGDLPNRRRYSLFIFSFFFLLVWLGELRVSSGGEPEADSYSGREGYVETK